MTFENFIKGRLVSFIVDEAQCDPCIQVQLAVAQCLANRVEAGWCGGDWLAVIDNAPEVTGTTYPHRSTINVRDVQFRDLLRQIDDVYYGSAENMISMETLDGDDTITPLYYCVAHNVNRDWFKENILSDPEAHRMVATVGPLTFFT